MRAIARLALLVCLLGIACFAASPEKPNPGEELQRANQVSGHYGGNLSVGGRAEPKTFNPVIATDAVSREITGRLMADLIEINRSSQQTEPALAKSWKTSPDGRSFTLQLRKGIRFPMVTPSMPMMSCSRSPFTWTRTSIPRSVTC